MVCAVDVETNTYGTIRMAREISTFEPSTDDLREAQATRGVLGQNGDREVVEHYHFELFAPDFDDKDYEICDMIADNQIQLRDIFESLSFEGVGFNPGPPEFILYQRMTWFYSSEPLSQ